MAEPGRMTKAEFDENMADLTAFLVWVSGSYGTIQKTIRRLGFTFFFWYICILAWSLTRHIGKILSKVSALGLPFLSRQLFRFIMIGT